ncbi:MAG: hypothetical protein AAFV93_07175 [Chloroflexota bacterium]
MFERIGDLLTTMLSVIAAISAFVGVLEKLLQLRRNMTDEEDEITRQLEKDIVRLQADLKQQQAQIEALQAQRKSTPMSVNMD